MTAAAHLAIVRREDEKWLSQEEVLRLTRWTDRWLREKVASGDVISRESDRIGANGRRLREYLASSLPQSLPAAPPAKAAALAPLGPLFANVPAASAYRTILPDPDAQAQASERMAILQPLIDFEQDPRAYAHLVVDGQVVNSQERLIAWLCQQHNVSAPTLKRWKQRYKAGGFPALADRVRADKGQSRWFAQNPKARSLAAYLYLGDVDDRGNSLGGRQSVSAVYDSLIAQADVLGIAPHDLPSRETVRLFLSQEISAPMRVWAREGKRAYSNRMSPYLSRLYSDVFSNEIWVGDHMIHDREVANDIFEDQPWGAPIRIRLSAMEDFRSRKIVGASWAWEGSSRAIAATMLRGILQYGPPSMIYVDNGKDYRKVAKGAQRGFGVEGWQPDELMPIEQQGILARLGIGVTHCIPRHPQSKHVERFFKTLHGRFDSLGATYTSGSPFTRPEATEEAMMRHRRLLKSGRVGESDYPLASTFILAALSWIQEYNDTPHQGRGMDGATPNQVFEACLNPNQKPVPEFQALALLLREFDRRKVRECAVTVRKHRYVPRSDDRAAWAAMHEANEREILVAYDPQDPEFAVACDLDGRPFAWLEAEQYVRMAPQDPDVQRQIGDSMSIRRGLEKATKATVATIAADARSHGGRSPEELLASRLQLPANTAPVITQRKPRTSNAPERPARQMTPAEAARLVLEGK